MQNGTCPKCGTKDVIPKLTVIGNTQMLSGIYVELIEPDPPNRPFVWKPGYEQSRFLAWVCGNCGYSEMYATRPKEMLAAYQKGFKNKFG
jgi:predicted nucleic-acid-binding Zn-ribbon protein